MGHAISEIPSSPSKSRELAQQVAGTVYAALDRDPLSSEVTALVRGSSTVRLDGACLYCGYRFSPQILIVEHPVRGRRSISERSLHYLSHGMATHETGHIVEGQPVLVEIDVADWARFLGLDFPDP